MAEHTPGTTPTFHLSSTLKQRSLTGFRTASPTPSTVRNDSFCLLYPSHGTDIINGIEVRHDALI